MQTFSAEQVDLAILTPEERVELYQLLEARELLKAQSQLRDLASFSRLAWQVLEPGTPLLWNWHLDLICEYLTLVQQRVIRRLIINVPPQTMKSRLVNVFFPVWTWTQIPTRRFLSSSYSGDLSAQFNIERSKLVRSSWFQDTFPGVVGLTRDRQDEIENQVGGRMTATSTGGTATGKGAHDVIVDDPLNPKQAASEVELNGANDFFDQTLRTRLSDQITGVFVIVMQRLDHRDLTGHVIDKEPGAWTHIRIPMEAEENERWEFPISHRVHERAAGELLMPSRFPRNIIEGMKVGMGSFTWAGQYQQRPTPRGGAIIKRDWIRYWTRATLPERFDEVIQSWDMSFGKTDDSSFVVGSVYGRAGARKLLLAQTHRRMEYTEARQAVKDLTRDWPQAHVKLVENKANGPAIISDLRAEISGLIAIEPDGDKAARMMAVAPEYESGCVEYPDPSMPGFGWVTEHVEEICRFPQKPNDRGDAESQALRRLRTNVGGIFEFYRVEAERLKSGAAAPIAATPENANAANPVPTAERTTAREVYGLSG